MHTVNKITLPQLAPNVYSTAFLFSLCLRREFAVWEAATYSQNGELRYADLELDCGQQRNFAAIHRSLCLAKPYVFISSQTRDSQKIKSIRVSCLLLARRKLLPQRRSMALASYNSLRPRKSYCRRVNVSIMAISSEQCWTLFTLVEKYLKSNCI